MVPERIRQRYLRDPMPIRLAGLASDLSRIAACAAEQRDAAALLSLLEEGKWFAEWAAPDAPLDIQATLAEVQVLMAVWQLRWIAGRPEPLMAEEARRWSDRLLALSGLV